MGVQGVASFSPLPPIDPAIASSHFLITPSATTIKLGEAVTLRYAFITENIPVERVQVTEVPAYDDSTAVVLEFPENAEGHGDVINGRAVTSFSVLEVFVRPVHPGQ